MQVFLKYVYNLKSKIDTLQKRREIYLFLKFYIFYSWFVNYAIIFHLIEVFPMY